MGKMVCRMGDLCVGTCTVGQSHPATGYILLGSPTVFANKLGVARCGDFAVSYCHGAMGKLIAVRPVLANKLSVIAVGDFFVGAFSGKTVEGSPTVFVGDEPSPAAVDIPPASILGGMTAATPKPTQSTAGPPLPALPPEQKVEETPPPAPTTPPVSCMTVSDPPPDNFQLSPNFILSDLSTRVALPQSRERVSAQAGLTVQEIVCNLQGWCENVGEALIAHVGGKNKITITSGFRQGNGASQHHKGQAVDVQCLGLTNPEVYDLSVWVKANIPFDQLILEYGGRRPWLHISFNRAGNRPSTASNKFGTQLFGTSYAWRELQLRHGNDNYPIKMTT